jgi:hypothetical protein
MTRRGRAPSSSKPTPEMSERQPGISGRTPGETSETNPAANAATSAPAPTSNIRIAARDGGPPRNGRGRSLRRSCPRSCAADRGRAPSGSRSARRAGRTSPSGRRCLGAATRSGRRRCVRRPSCRRCRGRAACSDAVARSARGHREGFQNAGSARECSAVALSSLVARSEAARSGLTRARVPDRAGLRNRPAAAPGQRARPCCHCVRR